MSAQAALAGLLAATHSKQSKSRSAPHIRYSQLLSHKARRAFACAQPSFERRHSHGSRDRVLLAPLPRHAKALTRPDHHLIAHRLKLACRKEGRTAELGHVGQKRNPLQSRGEFAKRFLIGQRFRKNCVGSCIDVKLGARDRCIHAFAGDGIRARDNDEVAARLACGVNFQSHIVGSNQFLVVEMAALLGQQLILDIQNGFAAPASSEASNHLCITLSASP